MRLLEIAIHLDGHFVGSTKVACPEVRGEPIELDGDTEMLVTVVTPEKATRVLRGTLVEIGFL